MRQPQMDVESAADSRRAPRVDIDGKVTIRFAAGTIVGSGRNIAEQGVFFTADGALPVSVEIEGHETPLRGSLVRLESMGSGRIGIAVKFDEPVAVDAASGEPPPRA